jgi:hypothetical protein
MSSVHGTCEEVPAATGPGIRAVAQAGRDLVRRVYPDTVEVGRSRERSRCCGFGAAKMSRSCAGGMPHAHRADLGVFQGTRMHDSEGLLEGTGKTLRHVSPRSVEDVSRPAVRALIEADIAERVAARGSQP